MHIAEGVLEAPILIAGGIATAGFVIAGFKKMDFCEMPQVAVFSALFFIASFIHVPLGPTSVHLILNGIIGLLLGLSAYPAMFMVLLIQALLFGFGGLTTLGVNTFIMGFPAVMTFLLIRPLCRGGGLRAKIGYFSAGFLTVFFSAFFLSAALWLSGEAFATTAKIAFVSYLPVMLIEGIVTLFALLFLQEVYPRAFEKMNG